MKIAIPKLARTRTATLAAFTWIGVAACGESKKATGAPPPPTVYVASVARRDVPLYIEAVASLDGYDNADIRARVRGYLQGQNYKDGSAIKRGQALFMIENTEYVALLNAARAALARARVAQARNRIQLERDQGLFKTGMISQQDLDNVAASLADSDGQVQAAEAQVQQAQLNLSYTKIQSPIDGVAGIALVRAGNLVGQDGPTLLTTVSQLDPIRVNFPMSENDFVQYPDRFKNLEARDLTWARAQFAKLDTGGVAESGDPGVEVVLSDGSIYPHRGVLVAANRQIDPGTGTIQLQALVPNADAALRPGQYGRVRIRRQEAGRDTLVVPEKALLSVQGTYSVGVVGPDNKVQLRRLELGPSVQGMRIVSKGIAEGDRIVVEGVQKISDGALVDPKPVPQGAAESSAPGRPAASKN
ncbi:MAG TPA: efflux RND transporter periplasmic adaptor subunit [Polyangiaceae bacterium]|nr:efflux RND transporter periplasmic adaptor subunit [Polyangiaceae bacterium]